MFRIRSLPILLGLAAVVAACQDNSPEDPTGPDLGPAGVGAEPKVAALRWAATRLSIRSGLAVDVNNQGQVVGYHNTTQGTRAFLWHEGTLRTLGTLGGGDSRAFAINEAGQIVGSSTRPDGLWHAFLWEEGTMRDLGTLGDDVSTATAIDANGRVVGYTEKIGGVTRAFLWENGRMRRLAGLGTGHS